MAPGPGETILFFPIDDQQQRNAPCLMRQKLRLSEEPICDLLVFFANESKEIVLCLVELKGREIAEAVKQIETTYHALNTLARSAISPRLWERVHLKGYILMHGSMPKKEVKKFKDPLEDLFGAENYAIERNEDLGDFLRQTQDQKQQKKDKPARKQKR